MVMKRNIDGGIVLAVLVILVALGIRQTVPREVAAAQIQKPGAGVPMFEVDPFWPKMEGHFGVDGNWMMGATGGNAVDLTNDHAWVLNRSGTLGDDENYALKNPSMADCCVPAPPVLEFDAEGHFIQGWGGPGPGYHWAGTHGLFIDYRGNVWISGSGKEVLKFTQSGKFLLQIGKEKPDVYSDDPESLNFPTQCWVYPKTNEVFISDGYMARRVIVFDADTGAFKRMWGGYGNKPDDWAPQLRAFEGPAAAQFNVVHTIAVSNDGLVYVGDRNNNRIQVFKIDGAFVKEAFVDRKWTDPSGTVCGLTFSADAPQQFLYDAGCDNHIHILNRDTLQELGKLGRLGHYPGQFYHAHTIAVDSKGNLYVGDASGDGRRSQKLVFKGISSTSTQ
jgi:DNA-binding beta-propeller fold protein YncE